MKSQSVLFVISLGVVFSMPIPGYSGPQLHTFQTSKSEDAKFLDRWKQNYATRLQSGNSNSSNGVTSAITGTADKLINGFSKGYAGSSSSHKSRIPKPKSEWGIDKGSPVYRPKIVMPANTMTVSDLAGEIVRQVERGYVKEKKGWNLSSWVRCIWKGLRGIFKKD